MGKAAPKATPKKNAAVKAAAKKAIKQAQPKATGKAKSAPEAVVTVPDGLPVTKAENQRLLNVLKYRADPDKNKKAEHLEEAQKVLQAGWVLPVGMWYT